MPDSDCRKRMYGRMRSLRLYQLGEGSLVRAELESYPRGTAGRPAAKLQRAAADGL